MMKSKRRWMLWGSLLGIVVGSGAFGLVWMMGQSLYALGDVRSEKNLRGPLEPPVQTGEKGWQVEADIQLHFEVQGQGRRVLLVHGGPGVPSRELWKGLQPLTDRYAFLTYDQRGCGRSTRPFDRFDGSYFENLRLLEKTLGLGAQIADIERIRRILGEEQLILIGHSYGGFLATLYAAEFPDRVEKLVLVAPAGVLSAPDEETDLFSRVREVIDSSRQREFDEVLSEYLDFSNLFSKSEDELIKAHQSLGSFLLEAMGYERREQKEGARPGGWMVYAMYFSAGTRPDYRSALEEIQAPTLILHGKDDVLTLAGSRGYAAIPRSEFVEISNPEEGGKAGHFVFNDCAKEFAREVETFLLR